MIRTRVFDLCAGRYRNLSELAQAMGLSVSQVYRVREGSRSILHKFIIGAKRAFPDCGLDDLFFVGIEDAGSPQRQRTNVIQRYQYIVKESIEIS